jgi:hypothetical protein
VDGLPYYRFQLVDRVSGQERVLGVFTNDDPGWRVGDVIPSGGRVFQIAAIEPFAGPSHIPIDARWIVRRVA